MRRKKEFIISMEKRNSCYCSPSHYLYGNSGYRVLGEDVCGVMEQITAIISGWTDPVWEVA